MLILWQLSLVILIFSLIVAIVKSSWVYMLISTISFFPIAFYFFGAVNAWKYVGLTPIVLLTITRFMWFKSKEKIEMNF
ncbi:hypothetical protein ACIQ2D_07935 [Lysinibacillus sp. NPDC097287]|uniref:hypothetical protein n=1 Tax=Lysinibacillus sp. NPDC097287 TaxID=3364144 RepID=UPI0038206440